MTAAQDRGYTALMGPGRTWPTAHAPFALRLVTVCMAASLACNCSATWLPVSQDAILPPWLRGLVSPSKAASLDAPGLGDPEDPLAAVTLAFPAWLAEAEGLTDTASADAAGGAGGAASAGPQGGGLPLGAEWAPSPLLPPLLKTDPPLLRELHSLENVRSAQRLEDAVIAFVRGVTTAAAAAEGAAEAEAEATTDAAGAAAGADPASGKAGADVSSRRAVAVLAGVRRWLDSELERLATAGVVGWEGDGSQEATGAAAATAAAEDTTGGDASSGGGGGGGGTGGAARGSGVGAGQGGELESALGHPLAEGLADWARHAVRHPLPLSSNASESSGGVESPASGGAATMAPSAAGSGAGLRADGADGPAGQGGGGGGGGGGTEGGDGSGRRRLQQSGGDGGGGGGGGAPAGGSATWVETSGIQGFDWRNLRPVRDAAADVLLNNQKPRTRATEALLQLYHIVQQDVLQGNVPFAGGRVQRWCENQPFVFAPSVPDALPEEYIGPSFYLTRTTGNCVLRPDIVALGDSTWTQLYERLACLSPSLQYLLLPAQYNGPGDQPESFLCPQCVPVERFGRALDLEFYPMKNKTIRFPSKRAFLKALASNATSSPLRLTRAGARRATSWLLRNLRSHLKDAGRSAALAGVMQQADLGPFATAATELLAAVAGAAGPGRGGIGGLTEAVREALLRPGRRRAPPASAALELLAAAPLSARRLAAGGVGGPVGEGLAEALVLHARQQQRELVRLLRLRP